MNEGETSSVQKVRIYISRERERKSTHTHTHTRTHARTPASKHMAAHVWSEATSIATRTAQEFYDSEDSFNCYQNTWGGESIHVGIYDSVEMGSSKHDWVRAASRLATETVLKVSGRKLAKGSRVCDLGSGYGGTARYAASTYGCEVLCVDASGKNNEVCRRLNAESGLGGLVTCAKELSFFDTQAESGFFDLVISQDSLVHAGGERHKCVREAARILKPGGFFVFSDIMQVDDSQEVTKALSETGVLKRIHLENMGSPGSYESYGNQSGLRLVAFNDKSRNLKVHYTAVREILEEKRGTLEDCITPTYVDNMIAGLHSWVEAANKGLLCWGYMVFEKE